jgi:putative ABC transport system permease protein
MRMLSALYRLVLLLYPQDLRARHGEEMEQSLLRAAERCRAEGGRAALLGYVVRALLDVLRTAAAERARAWRRSQRGWLLDVRGALRAIASRPVWALVLVGTVALPAAANTAAYSVVHAALLEPLPYPNPDRLVTIWPSLPERDMQRGLVTGTELTAVREGARAFESAGAIWSRFGILSGENGPEHVDIGWTAGAFWETMGVEPLLGRLPAVADDLPEAPPILLIGHGLWVQRFGADPEVVGRTVVFDGESRTIVGVMPEGFRVQLPPDALQSDRTDLWAPRQWPYAEIPQAWRYFALVGRLAPAATVAAAEAELRTVAADLEARHGEYGGATLSFAVERLREGLAAPVRAPLLGVLAAAFLALLVACVNAASLLLVRAAERRSELRLRRALGAGRLRSLRQILVECFTLYGVGTAAGIGLAALAVQAFEANRPTELQLLVDPSLGPGVAVLTTAVVLLAGVPFVLVPLLGIDAGGQPGLRGSTGDRSVAQLRGWLVSGQFAMCFVLLVGAGLLLRSFGALRGVDRGFEETEVVTARVSLPSSRYPYAEPEPIASFYEQLLDRVEASPEVTSAGATLMTPLEQGIDDTEPVAWIQPSGDEIEWGSVSAHTAVVTEEWFDAIGAEVIRGRAFDERDRLDAALVAVVDERLAARAWPDQNPIGRRVRVNLFLRAATGPEWATVIGVVRPVKLTPLGAGDPMQVWLDHRQTPRRSMVLSMKVRPGRGEAALAELRGAVGALDADLAVFGIRPMTEVVAESLATARFLLSIVAAFALLAAALAVVGVHGLVSHAVSAARREVGVRLALGATAEDLTASFGAAGLRQMAIGLALGLGAALLLGPALGALTFGVSPRDPWTFLACALLLVAATVTAVLVPLRRTLAGDPAWALRER